MTLKVHVLAHRSGVEGLSLSGCPVPGCDRDSLFGDGQGHITNHHDLVTIPWKKEGGRRELGADSWPVEGTQRE